MKTPLWRELPPAEGCYRALLIKRCRIDGRMFPVGTVLHIDQSRLRVAVNLCKTGAARPADARTRLDVALFVELAAALPE